MIPVHVFLEYMGFFPSNYVDYNWQMLHIIATRSLSSILVFPIFITAALLKCLFLAPSVIAMLVFNYLMPHRFQTSLKAESRTANVVAERRAISEAVKAITFVTVIALLAIPLYGPSRSALVNVFSTYCAAPSLSIIEYLGNWSNSIAQLFLSVNSTIIHIMFLPYIALYTVYGRGINTLVSIARKLLRLATGVTIAATAAAVGTTSSFPGSSWISATTIAQLICSVVYSIWVLLLYVHACDMLKCNIIFAYNDSRLEKEQEIRVQPRIDFRDLMNFDNWQHNQELVTPVAHEFVLRYLFYEIPLGICALVCAIALLLLPSWLSSLQAPCVLLICEWCLRRIGLLSTPLPAE